ncbi:type IV pilus modification PilV family protein [Bacillus taeanensis]|uniref:Prepilin-type N-terminal cleavage/methylation domain-containing protein n=1 Tax=Bacillus taeanensis TaxID=273032 RepID=A0A366Y2H8_9BACI|nr:type II secretion system protein [Bacillus taeanensis]RBW71585.1 hypothetical protein DS031_02225 [Bacillus taeanensis]
MHFNKKEDGFTLLEVLLSLSILSIVLLTFSGLFLQSTFFSSKNEDHLAAVHLAPEVLIEVKQTLNPSNFLNLSSSYTVTEFNSTFNANLHEQLDYYISIDVHYEEDQQITDNLLHIYIKIYTLENNQEKILIETFGYKGM